MKKSKKVTLKECIDVAQDLFEQAEFSIENHWETNEWDIMFGENSIKFAPQLTSTKKEYKELGKMIKEDVDNGLWERDDDGTLFNPSMCEEYGGYIDDVFEKQLGNLTGIGTQTVLELV